MKLVTDRLSLVQQKLINELETMILEKADSIWKEKYPNSKNLISNDFRCRISPVNDKKGTSWDDKPLELMEIWTTFRWSSLDKQKKIYQRHVKKLICQSAFEVLCKETETKFTFKWLHHKGGRSKFKLFHVSLEIFENLFPDEIVSGYELGIL